MIPNTDKASPHTVKADGAELDGHQDGVEGRGGGRRGAQQGNEGEAL